MTGPADVRARHSRVCWAAALGSARRGRPPEDWAASEERAAQLLAEHPEECICPQRGRRNGTRARGWTSAP
jgi:hypothetical protein